MVHHSTDATQLQEHGSNLLLSGVNKTLRIKGIYQQGLNQSMRKVGRAVRVWLFTDGQLQHLWSSIWHSFVSFLVEAMIETFPQDGQEERKHQFYCRFPSWDDGSAVFGI